MVDRETADKATVEDAEVDISRRKLLTACAVGAVGLAGCSDGNDASDFEGRRAEAAEVVEEFYAAYNEGDLERANELATEEYAENYTLTEEDFDDQWGGLERMSWEINDLTIARESEELIEVHADVTVTTRAGEGDNLDYFLMVPEDGEWRYDMFLAEADRVNSNMSQEEIDRRMRRD